MIRAHAVSFKVPCRRKRYDLRFKAKVVHRFAELVEAGQGKILWGMQSAVAKEFSISRQRVSDWLKAKELLVEESKGRGGKRKSLYQVEKQRFKEAEEMLYDTFYIRRQLFGLWVDRYWLCDEFGEILQASKPDGWDTFKFSKGWVWSFCKRFDINQQCVTNKKDIPIQVKEKYVRQFHKDLLAMQRGVMKCPTYGRFDGYHMFHWDQSPVEFAHPGKSTLNIKGTPCWMWHPGSGTDKRFISLQLCIRPWGQQIIKPIIIFRGGGDHRQPGGAGTIGRTHQYPVLLPAKGLG